MRYDPTVETFNDFLNKYKKVAKQAFGDKSSDITETFLFAELPVQMQNELAMAGKHDASMEEIRTFVQRRCQYAQLIPNTTNAQPFNQISAPQPNAATPPTSTAQPQQTPRDEEKIRRAMPSLRHTWTQVGGMQKTAARRSASQNRQPNYPATKSSYAESRQPIVCQICGKVGHSARDCYHRNSTTSAYRSVPYTKQSTKENKQFRRDFRQNNQRIYTTNELSHTGEENINDNEEIERHDDVEDPKNF